MTSVLERGDLLGKRGTLAETSVARWGKSRFAANMSSRSCSQHDVALPGDADCPLPKLG
jgi:hypothetical protein